MVSRIEAHLQREACVGSLNQWARFYRWRPRRSDLVGPSLSPAADRQEEVEVILREAGKFGYRPGSFMEPSPPPLAENEIWMELDDRNYRVGSGTYAVATDTLKLHGCGPNIRARYW
jgi:hypothetical protein